MLGLQAEHQLKGNDKYIISKYDKITNHEEVEVSTAQSVGGAFIEIAHTDPILPKVWKKRTPSSPSPPIKKTISTTPS